MTILITGGNGYIATSLYNALKHNHNVTSINRNNFDLTDSRLTNSFFENTYFDIVIHCAVVGGSRLKQDTFSALDDNLKMYYNLLENKDHFNKLIQFGSGAELTAAGTPYGLSKRIIANSISEQKNFYNLRIYAVFDEAELDSRFIKANIKRYINKEPLVVFEDKLMSFFYMEDLIKLVEYYIENRNLQKEIDCCYDEVYSLCDIANMINSLDEYQVEIIKQSSTVGKEYYGRTLQNNSIKYLGLNYGLTEVYNKLKSMEKC